MTFPPNRFLLAAGAAAGALFASACSQAETAPEATATAAVPAAEQTVMVGGAEMSPNRTIVENASDSADHTTLVAAVVAAGLAETLSSPGPFTVFAPTDAAFAKLPDGAVESLLEPANQEALAGILTYHVVAGRVTAADLIEQINAGGSAALTTVEGGTLTASLRGDSVILTDETGGTATVTQADVFQSNGVIHVTDTVSMPN